MYYISRMPGEYNMHCDLCRGGSLARQIASRLNCLWMLQRMIDVRLSKYTPPCLRCLDESAPILEQAHKDILHGMKRSMHRC
jgi:hypothetical protein